MTVVSCKARGEAVWSARVERPKPMILRVVAEKAGVSQSYVSGIERGVRTCGIDKAKAIARVLGRPFEDLFEVVPPRKPTFGEKTPRPTKEPQPA